VVSLHRIHEMSKIVVEESPRSCQVKTEALLKPHLIEVQRKKFLSFQVSNDPVFSVINILKTTLMLHLQKLDGLSLTSTSNIVKYLCGETRSFSSKCNTVHNSASFNMQCSNVVNYACMQQIF
jgi:hypothetical protein